MSPWQKSSPKREAFRRSLGSFSTKIHIRCEGEVTGRLITFWLTPSQESDIVQAEKLMEGVDIHRGSGETRLRLVHLVADKSHTSRAFREHLHHKNIG